MLMAVWRGALSLSLFCLLPAAGERGTAAEGWGAPGVASAGRARTLREGWRAPASLPEALSGAPAGILRGRGCVPRGDPAEAPGMGEPLASSRDPSAEPPKRC